MLTIIKSKTDGLETATIKTTGTKMFSNISAGVNHRRTRLTVEHNYAIPEGYFVGKIELSNFKAINGMHYANTYAMLMRRTKEGKTLTAREIKAIDSQLKAITCDITLSNGVVLEGARIDLKATLADWAGNYKKSNIEYEAMDDKALLRSNYLLILGKDLSNATGNGTMFCSYVSGKKKVK